MRKLVPGTTSHICASVRQPKPSSHPLQDLKEQGRMEFLVPRTGGILCDLLINYHPNLLIMSTGCDLFSEDHYSDTSGKVLSF
jgi:hypothetical protein